MTELSDLDDPLAQLIAAWRIEIYIDSDRELIDVDTALAAIERAKEKQP